MIAISFLQFLSPTTQMLIALVHSLGETPAPHVWAAYGCVWVAVLIFLGDAIWQCYTAVVASETDVGGPRSAPPSLRC